RTLRGKRAPCDRLGGVGAEQIARRLDHRLRGSVDPKPAVGAGGARHRGQGAATRDLGNRIAGFTRQREWLLCGCVSHHTLSPRWYIITDGQTVSRRWRG